MAKQAKRGPGRPPKNATEKVERRGRKPGIKNKTFLQKVGILADTVETSISQFGELLFDALNKEAESPGAEGVTKELADAQGIVAGMLETLTLAVEGLGKLPDDFSPGKTAEAAPLVWEAGSFVVFKDKFKEAFGHHDAYKIDGLISMGQGPGMGTMVRLNGVGIFSKNQLELVDASQLEDGPAISAPVKPVAPTIRRNGATVAPAAAAMAQAADAAAADDLNA